MLDFRPFTASDWTGYSSAERFQNGHPPAIAELAVDGHHAIAIWDRAGMTVEWEVEGRIYTATTPVVCPTILLDINPTEAVYHLRAIGFAVAADDYRPTEADRLADLLERAIDVGDPQIAAICRSALAGNHAARAEALDFLKDLDPET